ncbi:NAD-dependent epimerase/dehydratase family protein [Pedobacter sp. PLR]|uniref:NAD-dependent epimerase/dehydratase family protein n=1 Tax=Pedobacter sp. PLR TaxID=2994465 RepID=UPI0022482090|nr:NAD-dependent epimerase/dehydratase family protein [Pedobacter sp. PLR]MCX2453377.1 NAD-dependent epimerase/dehydratase family protein [Pedobacter sp. PLR]
MTENPIIQEDLESIYQSDINWSKFDNCTVLITGASGFLPAYLVESILYLNLKRPELNVKVIALVRSLSNAKIRFSEYSSNTNLSFIQQDVSEPITLVEKVDYIIHAASQASPKYYGTDPVGTLKANVLGTINLMEFALLNKIKSFLYFSSGEVYGEVEISKIPIEENSYGYVNPTNVRSCYAESKRMGENICVSYFHQFGVPAKIARPFHTYGPKMKLDDGRVYADFVANILNDQDICMQSDGSAIRAFCYLSDATIGFFKVLLEGGNGEAYNVGNSKEEHSILELAEILVNIYPDKGLKVIRQLKQGDNSYLKSPLKRNSPSINKISELNWKPSIDVAEGFKRTIQSYR